MAAPEPENGWATTALVFAGIVLAGSLLPFINLITGVLILPALVCGLLGRRRARRVQVGAGKASWALGLAAAGALLTLLVYVDTPGGGDSPAPAVNAAAAGQVAEKPPSTKRVWPVM